jgi:hypothetical protein
MPDSGIEKMEERRPRWCNTDAAMVDTIVGTQSHVSASR